ncbi:hypothetical protein roselon_03576 [Roseibacterium elongatum DSM 19469]|uniref:Uncharacterized protein n=1 Tax=Roseicyclus elongatus DSM 19469 TaxID=1294273 RepID=W8RWU4_9RHOB|nr:hypothetical protein [Roseibacterium elongatum]AHM05823.1 hypothetical protein roselon_03576 [Roseibacterium elongatum DSM 19469]
MTGRGLSLALQRAVTVALLLAACIAAARLSWAAGVGLGVLALVVYVAAPIPKPPADAWVYDRGPAVIGPDLLSFLFAPPFLAIPFWAEPAWPMGGGALHPSAVLAWPAGLFFLIFTGIGWHYAAMAVRITQTGLEVETGRRRFAVPFAEMAEIGPWRRGLPRWVRALAPLALALGRPGAAGAIMIARDSNGISIARRSGPPVVIGSDAFARATKAILTACQQHDVPIARSLLR